MKQKFLTIFALTAVLAFLLVAPALADTKTVVLHVPDMCASNEIQAQTVLEEIRGVSSVKTDMDSFTVTVSFDEETTTVDAFKEALKGVSLIVVSVENPE